MSEKTDSVEKKGRVGILRKRDTSVVVPNKIPTYRGKPKADLNPAAANNTANDGGGSLFSKRNKMIRDKPVTVPIINASVTAPTTPRNQQRTAISACPSTITIDSRYTTASHNSFSHRPRVIPSYLKNKTGNRIVISTQVQANKKRFNQIKKELSDIQKKAVDYYRRYRESLVKLNKLNGQEDPPVIEEMQIVDFKEDSAEITPPATCKNNTSVPLRQITDEKILLDISRQVHDIPMQSINLLQKLSERLSLINNQMNLATENSEGGDTNLFPDKVKNLFDEIETEIHEEEKLQNARIINFMTHLKQVMMSTECTSAINDEYSNVRKINEDKIIELETKIKNLETKNGDLIDAIASEKNIVNRLNASLAESVKKRDDRDKEFEKIIKKMKQTELDNKRMERLYEEKKLEVIAKEKTINELKLSIKSLQTKIVKYLKQIEKLENSADENLPEQINKLQAKYDEEIKFSNALRVQINELSSHRSDDLRILRDENKKLKSREKMLLNQVDSLKHKQVTNDLPTITEVSGADEELIRLRKDIIDLKEELIASKNMMDQKTQELIDVKNVVEQLENRDQTHEFKEEIRKLNELNTQNTNEIEILQIDVNKKENALRIQEESLQMQHRLLKVRGDLIQTLQENEETARCQISDLNTEVERRMYTVKQLNQEVSSKTEELENLFSTLGAKNLEVKRQDQIIKLLEETHERIRAKQDGRIARLENENAKLKRFIVELTVPIQTTCCTKSIDEINLRPYNHFYAIWRRQKRNARTLIKVKQYKN